MIGWALRMTHVYSCSASYFIVAWMLTTELGCALFNVSNVEWTMSSEQLKNNSIKKIISQSSVLHLTWLLLCFVDDLTLHFIVLHFNRNYPLFSCWPAHWLSSLMFPNSKILAQKFSTDDYWHQIHLWGNNFYKVSSTNGHQRIFTEKFDYNSRSVGNTFMTSVNSESVASGWKSPGVNLLKNMVDTVYPSQLIVKSNTWLWN